MRFIDLQKAYNRIKREALWQVLRMYDVGGKLLKGIEIMCISVAYVRVKGEESECFKIDHAVRQDCILSTWLFNLWMQ